MKLFRHAVLVLLVLLALSAFPTISPTMAAEAAPALPPAEAAPAPSPADPPVVDAKIGQLMQDRDYAGAIKAIDEAAGADDAPRDYLMYLKGRALHLEQQCDEAVAAFRQIEEQFPASPWVRRARFAAAVSLARKGDFRGAELVYRAETESLLGADRKQEMAAIYLEFADAYFKPPKEDQEPDFAKALEFYQRALEAGPEPDRRVEVELLVARCRQELGNYAEAAKRYAEFTEKHGDSPLDVEARFRRGECRLLDAYLQDARQIWQDLLAVHGDSSSERIPEVSFRLAETWKIPTPDNDEELDLGTAALETFLERFPEHKLTGRAHFQIAQSYVHLGRYEDAVTALTRFLADEQYKDREERPDALNLLGRSYQLQKKFTEALATWRDYVAKYPAHKQWSAVQRLIVDTEYLMGVEKCQAKEYEAGRKLLGEFLAKYPLDPRNPGILYLFGEISHRQKQWDEAITQWRRLVSKHPESEEASHGQFMIAATLEQELGKLEEALEEYRKVTRGDDYTNRAMQAIARLTVQSLSIATERVFRTDEAPGVKLTARNVESVTVRAYEVDLETYFRKMHLAEGVEQLDVALIDPDKTFEFPVPGYEKYQKLESTIEVPLPSGATSGVMAVTVGSKTLEATTLVIQSDLDVIVKSSRDEVFVFAENMRTGKPWPGVRLLVSNGRQVFAEAVTGADGVFQQAYKELAEAADVRVFAVADESVASNVVGLEGVGVARGLADKGYLYTDRPAYRAGQLVHVRGCLRQVAGDVYTIEPDKKYTLRVFDCRNRLLREEEVALNAFGSFHAHFMLPATSPQGECRVLAGDVDGHSYQGTFQVHEVKLEPIRLVIDTPRSVYYRGEEIEGTIRAEYYYGAPLAGRELHYELAGGRLHTATTDDKGEVHFKLPTREFRESQVLPLVVALPERNLHAAVNFFLACQGFSINVSTVRPVFVAGETFEVTVNTSDAEGKPAGRKLTLKVLEQTTVEGKVGERLVEEHPVETAAADGVARQTLKLDSGGRYLLRVEGTDRFENPISGRLGLTISGDEDRTRLRILADRHTYKAGDTAEVKLHWREDPALALVTFQGARVLDYRLVELQTGPNVLSIPMTPKLAPNFELAVGVMTDPRPAAGNREGEEAEAKEEDKEEAAAKPVRRFHEASSPFTVQRDLKVVIAQKHKGDANGPMRPGEELEVTVTTTDLQGNPVAAEVSLAMVEQALLERFDWPMPPIEEFFRGNLRQPAVRTTSSITFAYQPSTKPVNPRLLTEQERVQIAREEEASLSRFETNLSLVTGGAGMGGMGGFGAAFGPRSADPFSDGLVGGPSEDPFAGAADDPFAAADDASSFGEDPFGTTAGGKEGKSGAKSIYRRGSQADFDSLIELITSGIQPTAWESVGGPGAIYSPPTGAALQVLVRQKQRAVTVVDRNGRMRSVNLPGQQQADTAGTEALAAELAEAGAVLLPALGPQETGYWNPAIVTGADGKATVTFAVPERSTAWKLLAKGITAETLAGESTGELVVKKDLFGELKIPSAFTDGDEVDVAVSVHNDVVEKGPIEVTLKTTVAGRSVEEKKTIDVEAKGIHELPFHLVLKRPEEPAGDDPEPAAGRTDVVFELTVSAAGQRDVVRRTVPLLPYGMPVFVTAGGSATSDTTTWVEAPKEMPLSKPRLQILIGPTVERGLLDVMLGAAPWCQIASARIGSGLETATSDLMAALALQKLLDATREAAGPELQTLDARIRASIALLVSSQNDDGGWSWSGRGGTSNRYSSSRAVWGIGLARSAGYRVPDNSFNKALAYLAGQVAAVANDDYESKAILLHALATAGRGDFSLANRLYRDRPSLSNAALAYLALAFAEMDRKATAGELLQLLEKRDLDDPASRRTAAGGSLPWSHAPVELRALYALAVQKVTPQSPKAKELVDWLLAHRTGHRWAPDKATGPAAMALCQWFAESRFEGEHYRLVVFVNDVRAKVLEMDQSAGTQVIDVPDSLLEEGKQRINFQITGRGRYTYECILGGFVPADQLKSTTAGWTVERTYEPAPLEVDGREIPHGFGLLEGNFTRFRNPLTQLPVGRRAQVELAIRRKLASDTPEEQLEYLVVTEPIPSGATVIDKSVQGHFERFDIAPGAITFYVGSRRSIGTIRYDLYGYLPGEYRAAATVIRNAHRPEELVVAEPKLLAVLPQGTPSADKYRLTPQELFELGKHHFKKDDFKTAAKHLAELITDWNLNTDTYKATVMMLLDAHLELGPAQQVVHYFEIVKEKWPEVRIPFDKIVKVAAAYHDMGEYERSYLVYRATVESRFFSESTVAGFLDSQGEFTRSVDVMGRLLREYPPEPYVASGTYALAQRVLAKAPEAAGDAKLRREKINRVDLVRRASAMLDGFLTAYPDDPAADQAAFANAGTLLELEAYGQAAAACNRYAQRYPKSDLLDTFWYVIGYCRFATGEHDAALEMCRKVAEAKRVDPKTGREEESVNKWRAVYILGQVHHSLGQAAEAIREYRRVEDRFGDARKSIEYFLRKAIGLPEVTTVKPGEAVEVELKFRNIPACDAKVYRIDLMKFSLLRRNLGGITAINLSGIRPHHAATVELGDGKDYRDRTHKLPLPLKDEGAYLVVCRGEDLHTSGLVLVTPLAVEVQEDAAAGQVRTTVKDVTTDGYLDDVHVKVIGSGNSDFVSGSTDLRGVFTAEGIQGTPTVIARAGPARYAFFRGQTGAGGQQYREMGLAARAPIQRPRRYQPPARSVVRPGRPTSMDLARRGVGEKKIKEALDSPTVLQFVETPLQDVVNYLKDAHNIEIQIDTRALEDVGIGTDTPISKNLRGISLRSGLRLMLRELDLTYAIQDEVLMITTPEEAEVLLETKVYPVADLVRFRDEEEGTWTDFDSLIDTITSTVEPTTWDEVGGPGSVSPMSYATEDVLILSQTQDVHEEIVALLERLRSIAGKKTEDGELPVRKKPQMPMGRGFGGMGGFGGGMGGGMGGMGMGAFGGMAAPTPGNTGQGDLLQGLQDAQQRFRGKQMEQLRGMYQGGGMGGGVGAGAAW